VSQDHGERVEVKSAAELRRWLELNHSRTDSVWLVTYKKSGARPEWHVAYRDIVRQVLCFGWIDSLPRKLDGDRTMLRLSPRQPRSAWSEVNKRHVAELIASGEMTPPGSAAIERAKANGAWDALDAVSRLTEPDELVAALDERPEARRYWDRFPPSSRRAILEWIAAAKRPDTRARRIAQTVAKAAVNLKANFPKGRDRGPRSA
jgi:uncharacterized protein YdeI (YjbR/CyaY-like superfamily)